MSDLSIIKPLRPSHDLYLPMKVPPVMRTLGYPCEAWFFPNFSVNIFSAVEVAKDADGIERGPEYHISISQHTEHGPQRCPSDLAKAVLKDFGALDGWEEDNHVPNGIVRNYWRPVAETMIGLDCACKDTETLVIEGDYEHRPIPLPATGVKT
jgi:hypothetical protein